MRRNQKLHWYVYICKRYLMDILDHIDASKNEGERIFFFLCYAVALSDMSKAGNLHKVSLDKAVRSQHLDRTNIFS